MGLCLIQRCDVASGKQEQVLEGHPGWILDVAVSPNGRLLASGSEDKTISIWKLERK